MTGIQWVASEAWVTASLLTSPQFHVLLQGTLGFSFPGVYIPGLREFLLKVRPKAEPGFEFHNMLWEELFGCRVESGGNTFESNLNATSHTSSLKTYRYVGEKRTFMFSADENTRGAHERPVCTGSEDLSNVHSSYTEVSKVRISYNVYKAVYAIAHALHNLLECDGTAEDVGCKQNKSNRPKEVGKTAICMYCTYGSIIVSILPIGDFILFLLYNAAVALPEDGQLHQPVW